MVSEKGSVEGLKTNLHGGQLRSMAVFSLEQKECEEDRLAAFTSLTVELMGKAS